jgi:hypothetical protein
MIKLYRSSRHLEAWIAYGSEIGWVIFPDLENGWENRKRACGLDPVHLRQVPLSLAAKTGILNPAPAAATITRRAA